MEVCLRSVMILLILLVSMSLYIYNNILDGSMSKISDDSANAIDLYEFIYNNILDGSMSKFSDDSADTIELY